MTEQLRAQVLRLENGFASASSERDRVIGERDSATARAGEAEARLAAFSERDRLLRERLDREAIYSQKIISSAKSEFEELANRVMQVMADSISETSSKRVSDIIEPLGSRLTEFRERIESIYGSEVRERYALQKEIQNIAQASTLLGRQADDLSKVLRIESRVQGRWGEVVLERVLEHSGLQPDVMYLRPSSEHGADNGKPRQPDAAIVLPGDKHIVIDARVPLTAYEAYTNAENAEARATALADLTRALRSHVDQIAAMDYSEIDGLNPHEFSLMFVPAEGALAAGLSVDGSLFNYAWDRNVVIVSPTSLMMTLRTIADLWRGEIQHQNVIAITEQAGALHDEICSFLEEMDTVGARMTEAQSSYREALERLSRGPQSITEQAKRLRDMGSGARRQTPRLAPREAPSPERTLTNGPMEPPRGESLDDDNGSSPDSQSSFVPH
jgi:DNA recombination protein RmuC